MSDEWGQDGATAVAPAPEGPSAGMLLRRAREAAGLHVAALAVALKVPVRKLEALEEDRYDLMTDAVFVRGLAASVCRTLKIDPRPVLERLPQTTAPRLLRDNEGINAPFRAPSDGPPASWTEQLTRPVFLAVFALLLGALVIVLLPVTHRDDGTSFFSRPEPVAVALSPAPLVEPAPTLVATASMPVPVAANVSKPAVAAASAPAEAAIAARAEPVPVPLAVTAPAATVTAASSPVASAIVSSGEAANSIVVFRAKGPSWVEVTDAKGAVAVRKVLAAGEAASANGALPLHVTVGRSDMTDVQVRGKPFDLKPHLRGDNVARFDVK